eukprot:450086-Ditylum_brightwellii.AAC.1
MACHSFVVALAVLTGNMRVIDVTVIVAGSGEGVHFRIALFIAAVDFQRTKLVKGVNSRFVCFDATQIYFRALSALIQFKTVLSVVGPIRPMHFTVER